MKYEIRHENDAFLKVNYATRPPSFFFDVSSFRFCEKKIQKLQKNMFQKSMLKKLSKNIFSSFSHGAS